jgi:hypothetical protein
MSSDDKKCGCLCHKIPALFIIAIGVVSLLSVMGVIASPQLKLALPIILMVAGIVMLVRKRCQHCCHAP